MFGGRVAIFARAPMVGARTIFVCQGVRPRFPNPTSKIPIRFVVDRPIRPVSSAAAFDPPTKSQLFRLALIAGIPFVGFGFVDNAIMLLAGDAIDASLGMKLGISTLAAAGLGNLISDVLGIGAGEMIESCASKLGIKDPGLTTRQAATFAARFVKGSAAVVGISVGCLLGMFPLLFTSDRKALYFDDEQLGMYNELFQPYGVSPQHYFELMRVAKWRTVETDDVLCSRGVPMEKVLVLYAGHAVAENKRKQLIYSYIGKAPPELADQKPKKAAEKIRSIVNKGKQVPQSSEAVESNKSSIIPATATLRGCIVGGTALVDPSVSGLPYPNTVKAARRTRLVEWDIKELRKLMAEDKAIEAAIFSILYVDLLEHSRRQERREKERRKKNLGTGEEIARQRTLQEYGVIMKVVLSDGQVHANERRIIDEFMYHHNISKEEQMAELERYGWTLDEWEKGGKGSVRESAVDDMRRHIPALLKESGINARLLHGEKKGQNNEDRN